MKLKKILALSSLAGVLLANGATPLKYPVTKKDKVVDDYFGTKVADPYRWLENDTSKATAEWVAAQNKVTTGYLEKISFRAQLKERLTKLTNYDKMGVPFKKNGKYYYFHNSGLQNQAVLYVMDELNGTPRVVLDPNTLSTDGTVALQGVDFSHNGKYMAYVISRSGSDWNEIYVIDLATGKQLPDHITWAKFTDAQWLGDGFFYSAYDAPKDGNALSAKNEYQKVYYHKIGTPQSDDRLEYQDLKYPLRFYSVGVADDESYMYLTESEGHGNNLYIKNLKNGEKGYTLITNDITEEFYPMDNIGDTLLFLTNSGAPMRKVISASLKDISNKNFSTVIPESDAVLNGAFIAGDKIIALYDKDASSHPALFTLDGKSLGELALPALGTVSFSGDKGDNEAFYSLNSYTYPGTIYHYDVAANKSTLFKSPKVSFNPSDYVTEQVTYKSKDGTPIKMFLTYKKGLKRDGNNPVFLYGYGGFNVSLTPGFNPFRFAFIEDGGIYAVATLRGGGEFGEKWHQAGTKMNKQNVFDDFISAAEYLVTEKYTNPSKLAINGGSNGGLLVGAVVNQRPDLFRVAVAQVGVMDMLRYHKFTIGWNWAPDYGTSADSPEMFKYLKGYSPLHTIKNDGTKYPAMLITTADHDDRVVPAHSFKYAAQLQASNTGNEPKIIRIDSKAGHGGGKPISKQIDEYTDVFAFIMQKLGMTPKK